MSQQSAPGRPPAPGRPERVGLVLGSGAARGWAHLGVLQAIDELAIRVDVIAGTSIGALVGAVYASRGIEQLKEVVLHFDRRQLLSLLDLGLRQAGLIDGKRVADELREQIRQPLIEDLEIPFQAVATDLGTGEEVALDRGDVIEAVRASISIPGVFTPVTRNDRLLVDGGLVNPVPVSVARAMGADFVIAVDINHYLVHGHTTRRRKLSSREDPEAKRREKDGSVTKQALPLFLKELKRKLREDVIARNKVLAHLNAQLEKVHLPELAAFREAFERDDVPSILEVLLTSTAIMETRIGDYRMKLDRPDLLILPEVGEIRSHEFSRGEETIAEGYRAAVEALTPLRDSWWPLAGD